MRYCFYYYYDYYYYYYYNIIIIIIIIINNSSRLSDYIKWSQERQITEASNNTDNMRTNRTSKTRKQKREEKQLHGYFKREIGEISNEKTWSWLRKGNIKREIESLLTAAQNNPLRTNYIKDKIDNSLQNR